ncbi:LOW QUALITY PROTEIN: spondin-1 [Manduca sexta]|uniref:LOW QUALITY PROTEIN: spondin-1 n=1 Tax=Manduca sexta TaxID=7130 RepID=UPI00188E40AA|nr:LOW QUALITY PROTEIN: spondin-1 [Manduca sexta]
MENIKRWVTWSIFSTSLIVIYASPLPQCERAPARAAADAYYRLGIAGEPDLFLPGELYTVSLHGVDSGQGATPFIGFAIWAELSADFGKDGSDENGKTTVAPKLPTLGVFQAYDAQTKIHESCAPAVDNATAHPKTEVQILWNAPLNVANTCIRLCARVGPAIGAKTWSVLARKICPTSVAPSTFARQPPIVEPCCACDEAKYEITFEGLWSRNTHPRVSPESAHAHFGDLIGASHTAQYRVWQEGRVASTGLRRLADDGATTALEKELKAESDHIRTIIKARGISWQQVAGVNNPSTFAVFRVDAKHHLVSLAAKLAPSPDWIVGVSALELCNANCTWRRSATLPLYPYDAGTDSGISYTSRRMPTIPAAPVRALRSDWPRDTRSPFYSSNVENRPFARLRLTRLRLYEKSCDAPDVGHEHVPEVIGSSGGAGACATHAWGAWGPCSVTCGPGRAARQRQYVWPHRARADACRTPLTDYRRCHGPRMHCKAPSEYEPDPAESSGPCAVSQWSEWSPCEGCGVRGRSRHYLAPRAHKRCHVGYRARMVMDQAMPCDAGPCEKPRGPHVNATNFDWFYVDTAGGSCAVTGWGGWSPCSARCGRGRRVRARLYVSRDPRTQHHLTRTLLESWNRRFAHLQKIETAAENITADDPEIESLVQEHLEKCQFTLTLQEALCDGDEEDCMNSSTYTEICKLPVSVGHCRGYEERWFYDSARNSCEPFGFSGCGGNNNNFPTRDVCLQKCRSNQTVESVTTVASEVTTKKLKPTPSSEDNEVVQNDTPVFPEGALNCAMGPWLGWSNCFGDCKYAVKLNYRLIMHRSVAGAGKFCGRLVKSRLCKPTYCRQMLLGATTDATDVNNIDKASSDNDSS